MVVSVAPETARPVGASGATSGGGAGTICDIPVTWVVQALDPASEVAATRTYISVSGSRSEAV